MRTGFEELDVVQEKEADGYYSKRAVVMWCLIGIVIIVGYVKWNVC